MNHRDKNKNADKQYDVTVLRLALWAALIAGFPVYGMLSQVVAGAALWIALVTIETIIFVAVLLVLLME